MDQIDQLDSHSDQMDSSIISNLATPQSADGTLVVIVCRAKHLPNRRKLDKQSPYVTLRLGTTAKKTPSHFRAGQTPDWTHEIRFDLTRERKPIIKLDVLDETKNDPTPIGTCDIDCSVMFQQAQQDGRYIHDQWYNLTLNGRRAGMIYLEMTFYPTAPVLPPKLYEAVQYEGSEVSPQGMHHSTSSYGSYKQLPPPPQHPSLTRKPSAIDDVFVSDNEVKRLLFRGIASELLLSRESRQDRDNSSDRPESRANSADSDSPERRKRYLDKLAKLKNRLQSKEPISTLWSSEERDKQDRGKSVSPINLADFDNLDELQRDIQFNSPRSPSPGYPSEELPPSPPAHSHKLEPSRYAERASPQVSPQRTARKPPPEFVENSMKKLTLGSPTTSVPYSADTIGLEDEEPMPTKVYFMDKQVKLLSYLNLPGAAEPMDANQIDPKYYAPTPTEHFRRSHGSQRDMDLRTKETGYLGNGKWQQKFSPSIFDRVPNDENAGIENKPHVPPKIPQGMSEREYYVLDKEKYLRDINGRRL